MRRWTSRTMLAVGSVLAIVPVAALLWPDASSAPRGGGSDLRTPALPRAHAAQDADRSLLRTAEGRPPMVAGHRGASAYRPEHSRGAYLLALEQGVDHLEVDVVTTRDGVLVARHDIELTRSTDVEDHPEFSGRRTSRTVEGVRFTGWFVDDFTWAELQTLRTEEAQAWLRPGSAAHDGRYPLVTLQEVIDLVLDESRSRGRSIGLIVEPKYTTYFRDTGRPIEVKIADALRRSGLEDMPGRVIVESFDIRVLEEMHPLVDPRTALALLVNGKNGQLIDRKVLAMRPEWLDALFLHKGAFLGRADPTTFVRQAHRAGLAVIVWAMSVENATMAPAFRSDGPSQARGDSEAEVRAFLAGGVDGFLADAPDAVISARDAWLATQ